MINQSQKYGTALISHLSQIFDSELSHNGLYNKKTFLEEGVTYKRQFLLHALSRTPEVREMLSDSYIIINQVADILLLNEVEIIYWSFLIETASLTERNNNPIYVLLFTGLNSKKALNDDVESIEFILSLMVPEFASNFDYWTLMSDSIEPDILQLNIKHNQLISQPYPKTKKNYNLMVEEICESGRWNKAIWDPIDAYIWSVVENNPKEDVELSWHNDNFDQIFCERETSPTKY
ncbi:unnamed protein product [Blepharisma stoltei]|uniref:Uncharacterized protein n=1 Tax=Blepharisma stoltei TaxID=1481888 RepID=A0AAU9IA02_9CILI|nr:unnamed protein product [Blepharisma stoltei]